MKNYYFNQNDCISYSLTIDVLSLIVSDLYSHRFSPVFIVIMVKSIVLLHNWSWVRAPSMFVGTYTRVEKVQLPSWPPHSQLVLHQRRIWGIHCTQMTEHTSEGSILALKSRADVTRSPHELQLKWRVRSKNVCKKEKKTSSTQYSYNTLGVCYA